MISISNYVGREQSYVKHVFLENYLEALVHKTASSFDHIVYVDGFAGPWQSASERFEDTSFGIALNALRQAKAAWKRLGRNITMSAYLVEKDRKAYAKLSEVTKQYPDINIITYNDDFLKVTPAILLAIPQRAFAYFFIDPKGWAISLEELRPLLARAHSEVTFNFMFDFINRAASMSDPQIIKALDALVPHGDFRNRITELEKYGRVDSDTRKQVLADAFAQSLANLGNYGFVAETTVLRPLRNRPLYCLFYASRHPKGIEVFRDCQLKALNAQSETRASAKVLHAQRETGQAEMFKSLHEMAPNDLTEFLTKERASAEANLLTLVPTAPETVRYIEVWPKILSRHVVRLVELNKIAARLRKEQKIAFPNWEPRKQVPQDDYQMQRPVASLNVPQRLF